MTARRGSGVVVRAGTEAEWDEFDRVLSEAFGREQPPSVRENQRRIFEFERSLVAVDHRRICGCLAAFSLCMSVPGAMLPVAGCTWAGVLPTHRRRGVLTAMVRRQLHGLYEDGGEPVAALYTTEPGIHGRYGYGLASHEMRLTIPRDRHALEPRVPPRDAVELEAVDPLEGLNDVEAVHARVAPGRPGTLQRSAAWARYVAADPPELRAGASPLRCVLAQSDAGSAGYIRYSIIARVEQAVPDNIVQVRDVAAVSDAANAALWAHVLDLDLTSSVHVRSLPVDDPLPHMLADPRRARPALTDQLHVRLVDLPRALAARTYSAEVDAVLEVIDDFCPWNTGRWRLRGDPGGAMCDRTRDPADVALSARELGAAYLGGTSLRVLAAAGRVAAVRPPVLPVLSRAFAHDPAPFCTHRF